MNLSNLLVKLFSIHLLTESISNNLQNKGCKIEQKIGVYTLNKQKLEGIKKMFCTLILASLIMPMTAASVSAANGAIVTNSFYADHTSGVAPLDVHFTSVHTGPPATYRWNFGDGTPIDTNPNPDHTYLAPGRYTVTLTVKTVLSGGGFVLQSISRGCYITVYSPPPPP